MSKKKEELKMNKKSIKLNLNEKRYKKLKNMQNNCGEDKTNQTKNNQTKKIINY